MKKLLFKILLLAGAISTFAATGTSPNRMGNQISVTFDCPYKIKLEEGVRYFPDCPDPDVKLDLYYSKDCNKADLKKQPCLLFIHGGGWSMGNEKKFAMFAAYAASRGYVVACISYRLVPEYEMEDCIEDCWRALKWLRQNAEKFGGNPDKIGVCGGSAGGHLACMLAVAQNSQLCKKVFNDGTSPKIQASVPMAPVVDLYSNPQRLPRVFKGAQDTTERAKKCSPLTYVSKDSAPMHILHSRNDKTVQIDNSLQMQKAYEALGLECPITFYESSNHAFWNTAIIGTERLRSWTDAVDAFDKMLK